MKERPIIFSADMVQAILDGRKTQTRRVIKVTKKTEWLLTYNWTDEYIKNPDNYLVDDCPYGLVGDRLWVRETWYNSIHSDGFGEDGNEIVHDCAAYKSTGTFQCGKDDPIAYKRKYKSPIFMPRWASRITLEITDIRVERVQDISEEDCCLEVGAALEYPGPGPEPYKRQMKEVFAYTWDSLNAKRGYPWSDNPWVWVIEFERLPQSPHEGLAQYERK